MLGHQRLELADQLCMASNFELGVDQILTRGGSQLLETSDFDLREGLEREIREGRPSPQSQRFTQLGCTELGVRGLARSSDEALEAVHVDELGIDVEHVTR